MTINGFSSIGTGGLSTQGFETNAGSVVQTGVTPSDNELFYVEFNVGGTSGTSGTSGAGFTTIATPATNRILTADGTSTNSACAKTNLTFNPTTKELRFEGNSGIKSNSTNLIIGDLNDADGNVDIRAFGDDVNAVSRRLFDDGNIYTRSNGVLIQRLDLDNRNYIFGESNTIPSTGNDNTIGVSITNTVSCSPSNKRTTRITLYCI